MGQYDESAPHVFEPYIGQQIVIVNGYKLGENAYSFGEVLYVGSNCVIIKYKNGREEKIVKHGNYWIPESYKNSKMSPGWPIMVPFKEDN